MLDPDQLAALLAEPDPDDRSNFEGDPKPQWLCECGYGLAHKEDPCPKCHSHGREEATAFCEVPLSERMAAAKAVAKIEAARAKLAGKVAKAEKAKPKPKKPYKTTLTPEARARYRATAQAKRKARKVFLAAQAARAETEETPC